MTSNRKWRANRKNAKRSTGPRSKDGKERSAQNARRHGFASTGPHAPERAQRIDDLVDRLASTEGHQDDEDLLHSAAEASITLQEIRAYQAAEIARALFPRTKPQQPPRPEQPSTSIRQIADLARLLEASDLEAAEIAVATFDQQPPPPVDAGDPDLDRLVTLCKRLQGLERYERSAFARQRKAMRRLLQYSI